MDPNPSNYWAVFSLGAKVAGAGVAFIDMADVVAAFAAGKTQMDPSVVTYVALGEGTVYRPLSRGFNFVATPVYSSGVATSLAIVTIDPAAGPRAAAPKVAYLALAGVQKLQWVPTLTDEQAYTIATLQAKLASLTANATTNGDATTPTIVAAVALAVGAVALLLSAWLLCTSAGSAGGAVYKKTAENARDSSYSQSGADLTEVEIK